MATSPDAVRTELTVITTSAAAELAAEVSQEPLEQQVAAALEVVSLLVPAYYDAAGSLAVDWYGELRDEASPTTLYDPRIIGDPETDWIEREVERFRRELDATALDLESETQRILAEMATLSEKEIARGYRDSILGNTRQDIDAIGWSRIARPGACRFCVMLAGKGSVYRSESTAIFAAHGNCHCAARPEFRNGDHGPEADAIQYVASSKRAKSDSAQAARNAKVRAYLNENYPEAPG